MILQLSKATGSKRDQQGSAGYQQLLET
jgi:hypothetical protein